MEALSTILPEELEIIYEEVCTLYFLRSNSIGHLIIHLHMYIVHLQCSTVYNLGENTTKHGTLGFFL